MGVENQDTASPDVSAPETDAQVQIEPAETGPESSPAPEGEKFDLLSVVRNAVQPEDAEDSASPAGQEESDPPQAEATASEPTEPDEENFSDVPFHNHPRFKQLVAQRNQFRQGAQQYDQIQTFLQQQGISAEEAADALLLRAEMKQNPAEAWKKLKPMVQELLIQAGEILPADLTERVRKGEMTRDAALEVSRLRAHQQSSQRMTAHQQEAAQRQAQMQVYTDMQSAVAQWEMDARKRDPDFDAKVQDIQKEVLWLQSQGNRPRSAAEARKQVEQAYAAVTSRTAKAASKPAVRPVTGGRVASGNPSAQPKSILEIVKQAQG